MSGIKNFAGKLFAVAAALAFSGAAQAASWVEIDNPSTSGFSVSGKTVTYGPTAASEVLFYNGNITPQNPANIANVISTQFDLPATGTGSITLADSDDSLTSARSGSFTVDSAFDYLAIHYGQGELIFHWSTEQAAGTVFTISNLPKGLSNFRAYDAVSAVSAVPEPATYGMMLGGLGLIGFVARRRKAAQG
jgi:hypothetical protein